LDGDGDRAAVSRKVQTAEQLERFGDLVGLGAVGWLRVGAPAQRIEPAMARAEGKQDIVAEAEKWPSQSGVHAELVVRPFDCMKRRAQGGDLFAVVETAPADQHVPDAARLERSHVRMCKVLAERLKAPKQQTDVTRRDRNELQRV